MKTKLILSRWITQRAIHNLMLMYLTPTKVAVNQTKIK